MENKITKNIQKYPIGQEPDYLVPNTYKPYRFGLGKEGKNPLIAICMNPSAAKEDTSDSTINRIITISEKLGNDGWVVFNTYPERATDAKYIEEYNRQLSNENLKIIIDYLIENNIDEVWGAWGDLKYKPLIKGQKELIKLLNENGIKIFYFGTLTKKGNPGHPLQRREKWEIKEDNKNYLLV